MNIREILAFIVIALCFGLAGFVAPAEAGTLKDAAAFTEEKILPAADKATKEMNEYVKKEGPPALAAAKKFSEEKILPNAKVAGSAAADKAKKVWQVLISE